MSLNLTGRMILVKRQNMFGYGGEHSETVIIYPVIQKNSSRSICTGEVLFSQLVLIRDTCSYQ